MRGLESAFLLAVAIFLVGFCCLGLFYYGYSAALMRFPLLAAGSTLAVVAVQLLSLRRAAAPAAAEQEAGPPRRGTLWAAVAEGPAFWWKLLGLFSILPLILLFGYPIGLAIFLVFYLKFERTSWALALGVAAASLLLSYGLFIKLLGVSLPSLPLLWPS